MISVASVLWGNLALGMSPSLTCKVIGLGTAPGEAMFCGINAFWEIKRCF